MILPSKEFIDLFKKTKGAFSVTECIALINICKYVPGGLCAELGTHKGKSALASIYGLQGEHDFFLVEPEFKSSEWCLEVAATLQEAKELLNHRITPTLINGYSKDFIQKFDKYAYVFVDSGVHDDLVMEEVKLLEDRMLPYGIIAFHDLFNQFTAVILAYEYLLSTGKYEPIIPDWEEIINYVRQNDLETGNDSWHIYEENPFPNYVGALRRK